MGPGALFETSQNDGLSLLEALAALHSNVSRSCPRLVTVPDWNQRQTGRWEHPHTFLCLRG